MPNYTETINLKTVNMATDGDELFDFSYDLDSNWEKIDNRFKTATISLTATNWQGLQAPYTQTINIEGLKETDNPHAMLKQSSDFNTAKVELSEYSKVFKGTTAEGSITFFAKDKPTTNLEIINKKL